VPYSSSDWGHDYWVFWQYLLLRSADCRCSALMGTPWAIAVGIQQYCSLESTYQWAQSGGIAVMARQSLRRSRTPHYDSARWLPWCRDSEAAQVFTIR
jgi:hypothetical protein